MSAHVDSPQPGAANIASDVAGDVAVGSTYTDRAVGSKAVGSIRVPSSKISTVEQLLF